MEYVTSAQMAAAEINSEYFGVPVSTLMENAGKALFLAINRQFKKLKGKTIVVYCGSGNNGGDGFVAAGHLAKAGADVSVILIGRPPRTQEARAAFEKVRALVKDKPPKSPDIIIDAILGTGIKGALREPVRSAVRKINASKAFKLSVDLPTGLDASTGKGSAVRADMVITFHKMKKGLEKYNTKVASIGIPQEAETQVGPGDVIVNLTRRPDSHKGENGRVLVVGGSDLYHGAPILAGLGAHNSGADLVFMYVPEGNFDVTRSASPGFIVRKYSGDYLTPGAVGGIIELSQECDVLVIGPGLGERQETKDAVIEILGKVKIPVVIDADAIKAVGEQPGVLKKIDAVVTPHTREFVTLTKKKLPKTEKSRIIVVSNEAKRLSCVILLKSPVDIIASPEEVKQNTTGNPGMTAGGTGDVLSGVAAGLISQGLSTFDSACCAAFILGVSGDELSRWKGHAYTAEDVVGEISNTIKRILDLVPVR
ncbi:NAD(P)H-hydrate dehydratase [archaeon]|nr:NAD(P)H-hydrate dehydratase [archaeon]